MLKQTLLSLATVVALLGISHVSPVRAQELDLDEIDIFGDPAADTPADPATPAPDGMGDPALGDLPDSAGLQITSEEELLDAMQRANALVEQGNCDEAIGIYSQILQNQQLSRYAPALFQRGKCFVEIGELQLALDAFDLAAQYAGPFPGLAIESLVERGKVLMDVGDYQDALELFSQVVATNPSNPEYLFLRGKAQSRVAQSGFGTAGMADAISSFKRAISLREDYLEAYEERASAYAAVGEVDKAIEDYEQAVALATDDVPSLHARRGSAYQSRADRERGRPDPNLEEMVADYQAAIAAYSKYLETEEGKAPEDYEDADPEVVRPDQVYMSRAGVQISLANELKQSARPPLYERAIDDCNRALEFAPDLPGAYYQKGLAERLLGRFDDAIDSFTMLADISLQFEPEALLRRGIVLYYQGEIETARSDFEQALEFIVDGRAAFWIGATYAKQGDYAEAKRYYTEAIRQNPGYLPAYNNRGLANMQLGLYDRAFDDFDRLVRKDRNDTRARERREQARQMMSMQDYDPFDYAYDRPY